MGQKLTRAYTGSGYNNFTVNKCVKLYYYTFCIRVQCSGCFRMGETKQPLKLEDIPVMNFGRYMIKHMKNYIEKEALVSTLLLCNQLKFTLNVAQLFHRYLCA